MEGDTDGDIKKDSYIKERKVAVVLFFCQKGIATLFFYIATKSKDVHGHF